MRMEEFYLVKKSKLIDLVAAYYKLTALENSGVPQLMMQTLKQWPKLIWTVSANKFFQLMSKAFWS